MAVIYSTHTLHPRATAILSGAGRLQIASAIDPETLTREGSLADIIIVRAPLPATLFDNAPNLRAAIRHGAGIDMIPVEAATRAGILVANVPGANALSVAEHVFQVSLSLLRQFRAVDRALRSKGWLAGRAFSDTGHDLSGKTMGVVGMGNVGKHIDRIARHGFGLEVIANSRTPSSLPEGVRFVTVDELVEQSDIVVLCCPLTAETTGLMSAERISRMKPGAILVNVSRGPVVDDDALIAALHSGRIAGAALDVFSTQPLPADHPFFSFDNVVITPHMAGVTEESMMRMGTGAAAEALLILKGELPVNLRNPQAVGLYRRRFPAA